MDVVESQETVRNTVVVAVALTAMDIRLVEVVCIVYLE